MLIEVSVWESVQVYPFISLSCTPKQRTFRIQILIKVLPVCSLDSLVFALASNFYSFLQGEHGPRLRRHGRQPLFRDFAGGRAVGRRAVHRLRAAEPIRREHGGRGACGALEGVEWRGEFSNFTSLVLCE